MARHVNDRWSDYLGPGALPSLLFAFVVAVAGLGLPILWHLRDVVRTARRDERGPADAILVMGRTLHDDQPSDVFRARLDHGAALWRDGLAPIVIVTGGLTGTATRTEAEAGREYLVEAGLPADALLCEGRSRHTLENLFNVRRSVEEHGWGRLLVVSDPLHLARVLSMARGFGLDCAGVPAYDAQSRGAAWWLRAVREALLINWYRCGVLYSRLVRSERNLARVT